MRSFGILGCGKMGGAILNGVGELFDKSDILICEKSPVLKSNLEERGYEVTEDPTRLVKECKTVLLSVKPQDLTEAVKDLKGCDALFLSIAAGQSIASLEERLGEMPIVRAMPNTAATLGLAATCITPNDKCSDEQISIAERIFGTIGTVVRIEEKYMDAIIALSGSFIAFAYYYAQGFVKQAIKDGIDEKVATALLAQTYVGAGKMMMEGRPLEQLIADVCSKGGTTLAGLDQLKEGDLHALCEKCSVACTTRSRELGGKK